MDYKNNYCKHFRYWEQQSPLCEICGREAVDVHHIKKRSQWWDDSIENCVWVCRVCHNAIRKELYTEEYIKQKHYYILRNWDRIKEL